MISFIICSIDPDKALALQENIGATVGCAHECIVIDNRQAPQGLAHVYNEGARRAQGEVLCFVHEDVRFLTKDFGPAVSEQALKADTGVIGYLGTLYKAAAPSGWFVHTDLSVKHYIQSGHRGRERCVTSNLNASGFTPVVAVDGCCMMVSRAAWAACPFDERVITGFHGYDVDFCLSMQQAGRTNYVCSQSMIEHMSYGAYSLAWVQTTLTLHREKWKGALPILAAGCALTTEQRAGYERFIWYDFLKKCVKTKMPVAQVARLMQEARAQGLSRAKLFKLCYKMAYYRLLR